MILKALAPISSTQKIQINLNKKPRIINNKINNLATTEQQPDTAISQSLDSNLSNKKSQIANDNLIKLYAQYNYLNNNIISNKYLKSIDSEREEQDEFDHINLMV